ncbi:hypothetical protein ACFP3I_07315 [Chryseobacterium arachidis]|uniref:hypothetical protein n=1 Tax=Chryseobacterium arachidis TaxID=1416778 RepID=UPI00360B181B
MKTGKKLKTNPKDSISVAVGETYGTDINPNKSDPEGFNLKRKNIKNEQYHFTNRKYRIRTAKIGRNIRFQSCFGSAITRKR